MCEGSGLGGAGLENKLWVRVGHDLLHHIEEYLALVDLEVSIGDLVDDVCDILFSLVYSIL